MDAARDTGRAFVRALNAKDAAALSDVTSGYGEAKPTPTVDVQKALTRHGGQNIADDGITVTTPVVHDATLHVPNKGKTTTFPMYWDETDEKWRIILTDRN